MRRGCVRSGSGTLSRVVAEAEADVGAVGFVGLMEEAGRGCEMAFWPVITVPSSRPADM